MKYISRFIDSTAHDDNLFDTQKRLRIFGRCQRQVGQRANGDNSHRASVIFL